ncbi:P27 family phage terminase small subunit [Niallia sp. Man26]|uniref:P27 family phage terminase small subunit n=1 Tax=Niallia sp. Man26 TaxID=2912824 RepID=UPI001EDA4C1E|nr:P27 family phage terminase small subunit [Niallia sp. Man26]UPO88327.1 hypothetical protein L8T27_003940 [Niallia sp. Man26]
MAKLTKVKQDELIKEEVKRFEQIFEFMAEDKKRLAKNLIERVAFMTITLQILEDQIKEKGPTYHFKQGAQEMIVENPAQKSYNAMINRYTSAYDKLLGLLPKEGLTVTDESDGFEEFVNEK